MALYSGCASGCEREKIFDNSAFGYWLLAFGQKSNSMRGEGRCFHFATLCLLGIGFGIGWRLGHPSVTQGSRKGNPSAMQGSILISALFATEVEKWGVGVEIG
jgi:hypothetical protein